MARRQPKRTPLDQVRQFDYWSILNFARAVVGCSDVEIYRRIIDPVTGAKPEPGCAAAVIRLVDGLEVPCHRDLSGSWRISRRQYEAAAARHAESVST